MLSIALYLGLFVHSQLPNFITKGMTREHVEAILGETPSIFLFSGTLEGGAATAIYHNSDLMLTFQGGKVVSIERHRK